MDSNLSVLLKNVSVVDLEIRTAAGPNHSLRFKCDLYDVLSDSRISISMPILNGKYLPLDEGRSVTVCFFDGDTGVCSFSGVVTARIMNPAQPLLHIEKRSGIQRTQRRNFFRMPLVMDVTLQVPIGASKEKVINNGKVEEVEEIIYKNIAIITKDISGGGLRAIVYEYIPVGTALRVVVPLEKTVVTVSAQAVRCFRLSDDVRYDLGLQFIELEEKDRNRIIAYIHEKQRNLMKKGLI